MMKESKLSYSNTSSPEGYIGIQVARGHEFLTSSESYRSKPRILAFMGASGSGKDLAIDFLTSVPGRQRVSKKLELSEPVSIRVISKVTDRPPRDVEVTKSPISEEDFTNLKNSGQLMGEYQLNSNGHRYAYKIDDFSQLNNEEFLVAEPSVLHILELKERFGDQIHCTFLTSTRGYRERLLNKRLSESPKEIEKRLDEGDSHTYIALLLAGKSPEFIDQFVSPEISASFKKLLSSSPQSWESQGYLNDLRAKIGSEIVDILENVITHRGTVVEELITIDKFQTFIDDIVILEDKFITDQPYEAGLFSEAIVDTATRMLLNSENKIHTIDQTADTSIICNLVVPEEAKLVDSIFSIPYQQIFDSITTNQDNRTIKIGNASHGDTSDVQWISYYEDRQRVFGLVIRDHDNPESVVSFLATKPDRSTEALVEFQIHLAPIQRDADRKLVQMAFMAKALQLCKIFGVKTFHYAEHFDLVDEHDAVIGLIPRSVAHAESKYIHRASSVLVWRWHIDEKTNNKQKQLFMVRRNKNKKMNADVWQAAPSGHLLPGETYMEAARRELREELGSAIARNIMTIQPVTSVKIYSDHVGNPNAQKENFYVFLAHVDEDASYGIETNYESSEARWINIDEIRDMIKKDPHQFRDAFRFAFHAIDWDHVSDAHAQKYM